MGGILVNSFVHEPNMDLAFTMICYMKSLMDSN
jgi:hypothetical protein